ncbi:hypothetical protein [Cytobacillus gottheilii]|uniref:hypothetical protein n=1 Tax=Cytobacillus gottheilii TaxID=859144 RepID=UPI0024954374|nr:hypothetical protein [Cytobacillus gottheilii]
MKNIITLLVLTLILSGCAFEETTNSGDDNGENSNIRTAESDAMIGVTQQYVIGDKITGKFTQINKDKNYRLENMNFSGFVGESFAITYNNNGHNYVLYYPLRKGYITTPLDLGEDNNAFTSRFEVIDFNIENGTMDLKRVE